MSSLIPWIRFALLAWLLALLVVLVGEIRWLRRLVPEWLRGISSIDEINCLISSRREGGKRKGFSFLSRYTGVSLTLPITEDEERSCKDLAPIILLAC